MLSVFSIPARFGRYGIFWFGIINNVVPKMVSLYYSVSRLMFYSSFDSYQTVFYTVTTMSYAAAIKQEPVDDFSLLNIVGSTKFEVVDDVKNESNVDEQILEPCKQKRPLNWLLTSLKRWITMFVEFLRLKIITAHSLNTVFDGEPQLWC